LTFQKFFEYIYGNYILFLLNYSNLFDLVYLYFLIGFSVGAIVRDFYKYFKLEDEYISFILGKLFFYEKETKESFKKYYEELQQINIAYLENENNIKLNNTKEKDKFSKMKKEIQNFFEEINSLKYCRYDNEENIINNESNKNNVLNLNELEKLISKPYKECKDLKRKLEKINNLRTNEINQIKGINNSSKCCESKCCKLKCCKITKFIFFALICLTVLGSEKKYYDEYQYIH
jgi:predicted RNase H-like nuclease (RuvC/YqgF family)